MGCGCRETDAGLVSVGTVWSVCDKLLQGLLASWRSYLQLPNLKFHVVQVCWKWYPFKQCWPSFVCWSSLAPTHASAYRKLKLILLGCGDAAKDGIDTPQ